MDRDVAAALERWRRGWANGLLVGRRIDLRALDRSESRLVDPLTVAAGECGVAVLFRYGAVVLFNLQPMEEAAFLVSLRSVVGEPFDRPEREQVDLVLDREGEERVDSAGALHLGAFSLDRLIVVADVLAKSVALAFDESRVVRAFDRIEPVAEALRRRPSRDVPASQLLEHLGDVLITQHRMVGRIEVTEKPEMLWERPELDRIYVRLQKEYELPERHRALNRKLELISQTASTALGLLEARRSLRVEWYIVILIVIEIILTLYQLFFLRI